MSIGPQTTIGSSSVVITTIENSKDMVIDISPYTTNASPVLSENYPPKVHRKMQYIMSQIVGEVHSRLQAATSDLKKELADQV